jgi:hypothetical protein
MKSEQKIALTTPVNLVTKKHLIDTLISDQNVE